VSVLFFLWGFGYGILSAINSEIQSLPGDPPSHTLALHNAYWAAYFFGPLMVGYWVLKRQGFKATFMTGLAIYAAGAMSFWPSSVLHSFPGLFISNFIIALGLSCLEVAANPFIALAGPGELSEARINFAQGIQGIGSIVSPILVQKVLFTEMSQSDLFRVQWCFLAITLFVVFLAVTFFYVPLSEANDDDLEAMALQRLLNADLEQGVKAFGLNARRLLTMDGCRSHVDLRGVARAYLVLLVKFRPGYQTRIRHVLGSSNQPRGYGLWPVPRSGSLLFWYPSTHHLGDLHNRCLPDLPSFHVAPARQRGTSHAYSYRLLRVAHLPDLVRHDPSWTG
jgi:MFS family permease